MAAMAEEDVRSVELAQTDIMQAYLERPLLLNKRKFDIRAYMLVANTTPYLVLGHNQFYARLSCENYTTDENRREDRFVHLTNVAVQRKHPDYSNQRNEIVWSRDRFTSHLEGELSFPKGTVQEKLWPKIKEIMRHVFDSAKGQFERKMGYFDLFGMDLMLDEELRPWLLEVNTNPAMWTSCQVTKDLCPEVIKTTVDVVLTSWKEAKASDQQVAWSTEEQNQWGGFELLVDESKK